MFQHTSSEVTVWNRSNNQAQIHTGFHRFPENGQKFQNIKLVDRLINELETRFGSGDQETAVQCLFAVPSMLLASKEA